MDTYNGPAEVIQNPADLGNDGRPVTGNQIDGAMQQILNDYAGATEAPRAEPVDAYGWTKTQRKALVDELRRDPDFARKHDEVIAQGGIRPFFDAEGNTTKYYDHSMLEAFGRMPYQQPAEVLGGATPELVQHPITGELVPYPDTPIDPQGWDNVPDEYNNSYRTPNQAQGLPVGDNFTAAEQDAIHRQRVIEKDARPVQFNQPASADYVIDVVDGNHYIRDTRTNLVLSGFRDGIDANTALDRIQQENRVPIGYGPAKTKSRTSVLLEDPKFAKQQPPVEWINSLNGLVKKNKDIKDEPALKKTLDWLKDPATKGKITKEAVINKLNEFAPELTTTIVRNPSKSGMKELFVRDPNNNTAESNKYTVSNYNGLVKTFDTYTEAKKYLDNYKNYDIDAVITGPFQSDPAIVELRKDLQSQLTLPVKSYERWSNSRDEIDKTIEDMDAKGVNTKDLRINHNYIQSKMNEALDEISEIQGEIQILSKPDSTPQNWSDGHDVFGHDGGGLNNPAVRTRFSEYLNKADERVLLIDNLQQPTRGSGDRGLVKSQNPSLDVRGEDLAVQSILNYARENGFDRVEWTTGEEQNDRWLGRNWQPKSVLAPEGWTEGKTSILRSADVNTELEKIAQDKFGRHYHELNLDDKRITERYFHDYVDGQRYFTDVHYNGRYSITNFQSGTFPGYQVKFNSEDLGRPYSTLEEAKAFVEKHGKGKMDTVEGDLRPIYNERVPKLMEKHSQGPKLDSVGEAPEISLNDFDEMNDLRSMYEEVVDLDTIDEVKFNKELKKIGFNQDYINDIGNTDAWDIVPEDLVNIINAYNRVKHNSGDTNSRRSVSVKGQKPSQMLYTAQLIDKNLVGVNTNPTDDQIEAGNYKKGHINIHGMDISIENPKGSIRKGVDERGRAWSTKIKSHYGYIKGTVGKDKDHIDTFINPKGIKSNNIFVVNQRNVKTGVFDEHKVMMGYDTAEEARKAYLDNYDKSGPQRIISIGSTTVDDFKKWLKFGNTKKIFSNSIRKR